MDYEKKLRDCGHMTMPRIGNVPDDVSYNRSDIINATPLRLQSKKHANKQQQNDEIESCITISNPLQPSNVPVSAFCRPRDLPEMDECSSQTVVEGTSRGAEVALDFVPESSEQASNCRNFGSDKVKKENGENVFRNAQSTFVANHTQENLTAERSSTIKSVFNSKNLGFFETGFRLGKTDVEDFCVNGQKAPKIMSVEINVDPEIHENGASCDVEMDDVDNRFDATTTSHVSSSSHLVPICDLDLHFECSPSLSPKPDRLSRKSRSPKIVRKSWRPPYDCLASRVGKLSSGSSVNPVSFRSLGPTLPTDDNNSAARHCASPSVAISSLTLNSPASTWSGEASKSSSVAPSSACLTSHTVSSCKIGTKEPFRLISSAELKPKWRDRKNSDTDSGSLRPGSATPLNSNSSVVLNCQNIGNIVSCS